MNTCKLNGICGGCRYLEMSYGEQLKMKESQLLALLSGSFDANTVWEGIIASPKPYHYRNKMEYSFGDDTKDGPLTLGMHRQRSFYSVVTADECRIADADFNRIVAATVEYFGSRGIPYMHKKSHKGYLRHLLLRKGSAEGGELLADLVTKSILPHVPKKEDAGTDQDKAFWEEDELLEGWKELLLSLPLEARLTGILHTRNDSEADAVKDQGTELLWGRDYLNEELLGLQFRITPFSFFQVNKEGAECLYSKVREYVGDTAGTTVYDLYSGTGTIAQLAAAAADQVYGVEINPEAVEAARENAARNGLSNCEFIAGDVLKVIDGLPKAPDLIILDPPREGLHPKMLPRIAAYGVERIIYVSCKPESFVRDMPTFVQAGYRIERAACVDMFPHTPNIECIALIQKPGSTTEGNAHS